MQFNKEMWDRLDTNKKGDAAELLACSWLLLEGYEVYRNVASTGKIDVVIWDGERFYPIDVSVSSITDKYASDHKKWYAEQGKEYGLRILYVLPDGTCKWRDDLFPSIKKPCFTCQKEFETRQKNVIYCSYSCKSTRHKIKAKPYKCNKTFI